MKTRKNETLANNIIRKFHGLKMRPEVDADVQASLSKLMEEIDLDVESEEVKDPENELGEESQLDPEEVKDPENELE